MAEDCTEEMIQIFKKVLQLSLQIMMYTYCCGNFCEIIESFSCLNVSMSIKILHC